MSIKQIGIFALGLTALSGCVASVGPVEVTRFHAPALAQTPRGAVAIEPASGVYGQSLEYRAYANAVMRQLVLLGYTEAPAASASTSPLVAQLRLERHRWQPERTRNPVSVGVGGSTGSYGSGIGVGIGLDLSGPPPEQVETRLGMVIKDRSSSQAVWEGRASYVVNAKSPLANSELGAAKMSEALFKGFPGTSGETIQVK